MRLFLREMLATHVTREAQPVISAYAQKNCSCPVRTCWHKHKHKHKQSTSQSASTYINDVLTAEHKHKLSSYAYAYITIRRKLMLMFMSRLSSLAHKLLTLMFMLMLASQVRTGLLCLEPAFYRPKIIACNRETMPSRGSHQDPASRKI